MIVGKPFDFIIEYVNKLSSGLERKKTKSGLTRGQKVWIGFCIMYIMITESVCWRKFVRAGLGRYSEALLSYYFHSPMAWDLMISVSIDIILESFGVFEGVIVIDDTGKKRSKGTKCIPYIHYYKDKEGTGTVKGQETVLIALVTPLITIPVGYEFYQPDPLYTAWHKEDEKLRKQGVCKSKRPVKPPFNPDYPTKQQIALKLLEEFSHSCPYVRVKAVLADALYGSMDFMNKASLIFGRTQIISQLHRNQNVRDRKRPWKLDEYFKAYPGSSCSVSIRGGKSVEMTISSARLYVEAQNCVRFIVAIRYSDQQEFRYLAASDLSWRTEDIVKAYTLRWLVETVIEDLKVYEGWGQSTKQQGEEGSRRVLILSILCDHCLFLSPEQQSRAAGKKPLFTIGSLHRHLKVKAFINWLEDWFKEGESVEDRISHLADIFSTLMPLQESEKHMNGRDIGRLEHTPGLQSHAQKALAHEY